MTTKQTIERYLSGVEQKNNWEVMLADDVVFTSYGTPPRQIVGKDGYLQSTNGFYSMIRAMEVRELLVDGDRACATTRYELQPPNGGPSFTTDVAEVYSVRNERIASFAIYFDSAPFPKR